MLVDLLNPQGIDGVNFINIWSKADTKIGRALSNFTPCQLMTIFGTFRSIEGLIYYMGSQDEQLRFMVGAEAKKYGQSVDKGYRHKPEIFKDIIIEAMKQKWSGINPDVKSLLHKEFKDLPLVHYYEYSGRRIVPEGWSWQIQAWEDIRNGKEKT